jgi:hypothetical protein
MSLIGCRMADCLSNKGFMTSGLALNARLYAHAACACLHTEKSVRSTVIHVNKSLARVAARARDLLLRLPFGDVSTMYLFIPRRNDAGVWLENCLGIQSPIRKRNQQAVRVFEAVRCT